MGYRNLAQCVADLEKHGQLKRVVCELDPNLEIAAVQRRALKKKSPALLFTSVKGCPFPMLGNLFGTMERTHFIFRDTLRRIESLIRMKADPREFFRHPLRGVGALGSLYHGLPRRVSSGPVLAHRTSLSALPHFVSWPQDGGPYVTLPLVYTEHPDNSGFFRSNLGMYRVQLSGGEYVQDQEAGMHYQIHRGIGQHHARALDLKQPLPVSVFVGGPPALTLAAIMPMPEDMTELPFAGMLAGHRLPFIRPANGLAIPAEADFCITGYLTSSLKPEGPFGDHLGYYSLRHDFPVLHVTGVFHRPQPIWPFTSVGRPPQEDSVFGKFIHELTSALVPDVFKGIKEVHAVDVAGVHPLLLAIGSERYVPYEQERKPRAILSQGLHLLGDTQTCLAKYALVVAKEDAPTLSTQSFDDFFAHVLRRTDLTRDLHIFSRMTADTLDYTGNTLHEGSKMLWVATGQPRRDLCAVLPAQLHLLDDFGKLTVFRPGILVCRGPQHVGLRGTSDVLLEHLAEKLTEQADSLAGYPLLVVVDDPDFVCSSWENFLWVTFTRSDPATDSYGTGAFTRLKHWGCKGTFIIDARLKSFQPAPLEPDPDVERKIDSLAVKGGPLYGLVD